MLIVFLLLGGKAPKNRRVSLQSGIALVFHAGHIGGVGKKGLNLHSLSGRYLGAVPARDCEGLGCGGSVDKGAGIGKGEGQLKLYRFTGSIDWISLQKPRGLVHHVQLG